MKSFVVSTNKAVFSEETAYKAICDMNKCILIIFEEKEA